MSFLSQEQVRVLNEQMVNSKKLTLMEFEEFIMACERLQLDPTARQIYASVRMSNGQRVLSIEPTVDGLRLVAERSGEYEGQDGPYWCGKDGTWRDVWLDTAHPEAARVGVYRKGFRQALYAVAKFREYAQVTREGKLSHMWAKMPDLMIAKVAEALALRRSFPKNLSGTYTREEMEQSGSVPIEIPMPKIPEIDDKNPLEASV